MHGIGRRSAIRGFLALWIGFVALGSALATPPAAHAALSPWTGGLDLYRSGVFTTQKTWQWCTAADVQIIRNIVERQTDHSRASQAHYFEVMRAHNRYAIPVSDGVDPAGWTYGLQQFVDARYRLVSSGTFDAALRSAVTSLRRTNLPVGITVAHGTHAWVVTGFTATADPAVTTRFSVTSVRVVGPLWGLQSRSYGYDMRPDTKLTARQLVGFFTPWHYAPIRMAWEGRWVSIQPTGVPSAPSEAATPPGPRPEVREPVASASAVNAAGPASGEPDASGSRDPAGIVAADTTGGGADPPPTGSSWISIAMVLLVAAALVLRVGLSAARRPTRKRRAAAPR
ncbi:MAG TPA: hypothetical protein VGJ71_03105 [Candidatus Limnocylindrales bacterium]|jgi:hypothetical protein